MAHLYRHFDKDGILLYVGAAKDAMARLGTHHKREWYKNIRTITVHYYRTKRAALKAEAEAIAKEKPKFNERKKLWMERLDKTCPHCLKTWSPPNPYKKICPRCRASAALAYKETFLKKHPHYYREYYRSKLQTSNRHANKTL